MLEPAREVGGDLYDFFMLDADRLFFLIGDVSGKGLPGSLFMAVSKALYKSTALRRHGDVGGHDARGQRRDLPRQRGGALRHRASPASSTRAPAQLEYCNAGHEPPYLLPAAAAPLGALADGGGPPLCVVDGFAYAAARAGWRPATRSAW